MDRWQFTRKEDKIECWMPISKHNKQFRVFTIDELRELISDAITCLGDDYIIKKVKRNVKKAI